jgi:arabinogalactan oligomer/maltooligosaccharide transport system substrate-binding protein
MRVQLSFTDSAGVRWRRDKYGRLFDLEPQLDIWAHDRFAEAMSPFVEDFRSDYGVEAKFNTSPLAAHRELMLRSLDGDTGGVSIAPQDTCGELVQRNLVEPLTLTDRERETFSPWLLDALSWEGRLYGIPATLDTIVLYTNTDLVRQPPGSKEELIELGTELRDLGRVNEVLALQIGSHGDPYYLAPLFTSAGGWVFGTQADGTWNRDSIGVDTPESIAAYKRIGALGEQGAGILRREIDEPTSAELFLTGSAPFLISSFWGTARARAAGINFTVSPVPAFRDGQRPIPFVTVNGAFVSRHGRTKLIAHDFKPDYLSRQKVMDALAKGLDAPVALPEIGMRDPVVAVVQEECLRGVPMPSFPQMHFIWGELGQAEAAVVAGEPAEPVALRLAKAIRE